MWLIEAYRTQHGASFAREVLTVAAGTFPDANAIMVFTSFPVADDIHWRESDTGQTIDNEAESGLKEQLDKYVAESIGEYESEGSVMLWSRDQAEIFGLPKPEEEEEEEVL